MKTKKQIIYPLVIVAVGIAGFMLFKSMKKPPEEKPKVDNTPIVRVMATAYEPITLKVASYGEVKPKYETEIVTQVSGLVVEISDTFQRGGFVKKGQLLAKIDQSDYETSLIDAEANLASATASLEQERAQGKVAENEWQRITDSSPTELSLRKPQLAQELARVKASKAAIKRAERNLERTEIYAPYDALIESRDVALGSFVSMGTKLGKLLSISSAEIRLPVPDNQIKYLENLGENASVVILGNSSGHSHQWSAKIVRSEGVIDNTSRMSFLVAEVNDPYARVTEKPLLKFGSYITAEIEGYHIESAAIIPRHLIDVDRIAVLTTDKTLAYKTIDVIREDGTDVVVKSGLNEGDKIITSALDYPVEGMKLALPGDKKSDDTKKPEDSQIAMKED